MKLKFISAAVLSGILLSLAWLGFSGLILLIAFVPLFYLENYFIEHQKYNTSIVFWWYSLITLFTWNSLTTWWIWYATPIGALFAIILNTFLMSLVWWIAHVARRKAGNGFGNAFLIFIWISFEYLQFNWDMEWPWLTLGNGLANNVGIIQWYEITGVFGGTFWILVVNLLIWNLVKKYFVDKSGIAISTIIITLGILLIPICYSLFLIRTFTEKENPVQIVISQPNIDPYSEKFDEMNFQDQYSRLLNMADSLGNDSIDFFIGPETALHHVWLNNWEYSPPVRRIQRFLANKYPNSGFVVGGMTYLEYLPSQNIPSSARYNSDSTLIYDAFNSALLITKEGPKTIYHKSKLVSGVEKMPFKQYLGVLDNLILNLGGTTGTLGTLDHPEVIEFNGIKVGVPICYESAFGEYTSKFVQDGAELLFVITNDGWWKDSPGYKQHLAYSRILAIEMRRSIARSGNTGISCFINQKGQILKSTKWWAESAIKGTINRNDELTFYSRNGDYIARISLFMFILMGLALLTWNYRRK